ncbi:VOC family protein [Tabrizicola soli]|uniref:VOC family protein n=1 Tax=Tabrizicola soli TaxID=2185115 RepID=A0ABV7DP69_9RHOB|nr:VOC family protein [Tabrizicola soli]
MLVPELTLAAPDAGARMLERFGFRPDAALWRLGSQALRVTQGEPRGHGRIDHVALTVPDIDRALADLTTRGLTLDAGVTPGGPELIPEFWTGGLRFAYLAGPEGARIELCQRLTGASAETGQDHVGIPCADLAPMQAFFEGQGARLVAAVDLDRPEGRIPVRFLAFQGGMVELYQPVSPAPRAAPGLWSRLLVTGLATPIHGPEGLVLAPL